MQGGIRSKGYSEIITKAVCGLGRKTFRLERVLLIPEGQSPERVLGSVLTQISKLEASVPERSGPDAAMVPISGRFDINVWYAHSGHRSTALARETVRYTELVPITGWSSVALGDLEASATMLRTPECVELGSTGDNRIRVAVEFTIQAEVIGETKVLVEVFDLRD
jgi:spore coat protein E